MSWLLLRAKLLLVSLVLVVGLVAACTPFARMLAEGVERSDGASLTYVLEVADGEPRGVSFDPGGKLARGVIVRLEGENLVLLRIPDGVECRVEAQTKADCRLGNVVAPVFLGVSGGGVVGNASFRREGASTVFLVFASFPMKEGGE